MLSKLLTTFIKTGRLKVRFYGGQVKVFGSAGAQAMELQPEDLTLCLNTPGIALKLVMDPWLHLGEGYMNRTLSVEGGTLWDLMALFGRNIEYLPPSPPARKLWNLLKQTFDSLNGLAASRQHVAHHYDLSDELYRTFLDTDRQYSCAYFETPDMSLEDAQIAKKRHLIAKLDLRPGQKVLDIGCGWGGMALDIAKACDVEVTGITLSTEQLDVARKRAKAAGLDHRVHFELIDYRELTGTFDRIISVGMFEHVGAAHFKTYFGRVKDLLTPDGAAVIHSIGRRATHGGSNGWVRKYVFPGGYIPHLSGVVAATEAVDLWVTDVEILRLHYAETLKIWRERFLEHRPAMAKLYDERFCLMWEYYLVSSEMMFRYGNLMVFQMQVTKRMDALPYTRTYMVDAERDLASPSAARREKQRA